MFYRGASLLGVALFIIAIAMLIATVERTFFGRRPNRESIRQAEEAQRREELEQSRSEFARDEQQEAIRLTDATLASVEAALAQIEAWNKDIDPLRTNFNGRVIASDDGLTAQLFFLFEDQRL